MEKIQFVEQMKILTMAYSNDFDLNKLSLWYEYLKDIDYTTFKKTVSNIISNNKYMPSISELLEKSNGIKQKRKYEIIEEMKKDGYFATENEYDKAVKYLEYNIIPKWFKEDMKKYNKILLENNQKLLTN